jgi:hypothetical protein
MANIAEYLKKIMEARFGKDVRSSIYNGIDAINSEVEANTEASNNAVNAAKASATSTTNAEAAANKAKDDVAAVKAEIYDTAIPQIQQIKSDTEAIKAETQQLKTDTEGIRDDTSQIKSDAADTEKACAKYAEKCENATAGLDGGTIPCGSLTFEELPDLADVKRGWMYNVSNEFTTTEDFLGGADFYYPSGTNVCAVLNNGTLKWDCFGGEMSGYIMKRDFDATLADAKVEFEEPAELKVVSGITTIKNLFGNVAKIIKLLGKTDLSSAGDDVTSVLKALYDKVGNTDISGIGDGSVTGAISMLNSDNENARKEYKSLGSSKISLTPTQMNLANSITNYKELLFWLRNSSGRIYASVTLPVSAFRAFNSVGRSIGLEVYLDKRVYTSIWYSSDTSVTSISSETNAGLYWQIIGLF